MPRIVRNFVIRCPTPKVVSCLKSVTVSKSLGELAREVALSQGQPAGKEEDSEISDDHGPLPLPKTAREVSWGRHRLRMLIDHLMCRDGKLEESLLERTAVSATESSYRPCKVPQVWSEAHASFFEDVNIDRALVACSNDCSVKRCSFCVCFVCVPIAS